jgi:hypothetical protein
MKEFMRDNIEVYRRMKGYMKNNMRVIVERKNMEEVIKVVSSSSEQKE